MGLEDFGNSSKLLLAVTGGADSWSLVCNSLRLHSFVFARHVVIDEVLLDEDGPVECGHRAVLKLFLKRSPSCPVRQPLPDGQVKLRQLSVFK